MSALRQALGCLLVELYPETWRTRYRAEILALIDDDPPATSGLASLLLGACDAHLRPQAAWSEATSPLTRMRLSIGGMFCCWIALSVIGVSFQKETEEPAFWAAEHSHPAIAIAHGAVVAGAALGAIAIAVGGLPLVYQAVRQAAAGRDRRLGLMLCLPFVAIACFGALTLLLVTVATAGDVHRSFVSAIVVLVPWWLGGLACAATCAVTPRLALRRVDFSERALRRASRAGLPLALAMGIVTGAIFLYCLLLDLLAPGLSAQRGGPLWPSTGVVLLAGAVVAALSTAIAAVSASRAHRALAADR